MKLPSGQNAIVDIEKLRNYCLNPEHPRGRHKARIFASVLGLTIADVETLRSRLREAAANENAIALEADEYGRRFAIDFRVKTGKGEASIRSSWIIRRGEDIPRLTSCFVL